MAADEDPDVIDGLDAIVPITAPGQAPRDFTFGDDAPAGSGHDVDPTVGSSRPVARRTGTGGSLVDNRSGFTSSSATADASALLDEAKVPRTTIDHDDRGHVVGHDRLADVVATFGSTLDSIRASQGHAPRHNLPTGSSTNQKRIAQVVQATPIDGHRCRRAAPSSVTPPSTARPRHRRPLRSAAATSCSPASSACPAARDVASNSASTRRRRAT